MGRLNKLKREVIAEANKRILNEQGPVSKGLLNCLDILKNKAEKDLEEKEKLNNERDYPVVPLGTGMLEDITLVYGLGMEKLSTDDIHIDNVVGKDKNGKEFCIIPKKYL